MFENTRSSPRSAPTKVVQFRNSPKGVLSLISLIVLVASCLGGVAQARDSSINGKYQVERLNQENEHKLGQSSDGYEEFYVAETPFSQSDNYLKFNSFVVGGKFADNYEYTDECLNDVVRGIDSQAYFNNNMTLHDELIKDGEKTSYFEPFLNASGIVYGPIADSLPNCYKFTYAFYTVENDRFLTFNSNWGNFFLAFLFNQMGNALNFQTKFERIQDERDRQNYAGVWQEYGDLVYLIWTFSPIEEASLENVSSFVQKWMDEHEWLNSVISESQKPIVHASVTGLSRYVHSAGEAFGASLFAAKTVMKDTFIAQVDQFEEKRQSVMQTEVTTQITDSINGIFSGIVGVFPYDSNPTRCQGNFTQGYNAGERFYKRIADEATRTAFEFGSVDDQEDLIADISDILKFPFGATFSCWWGFSTVLVNEDPMEDGILTEDEALEQKIMISNDYITNLFFNLGYIYQASFEIYTTATTTTNADNDDFFRNIGISLGDIIIRFFWRKRFTRNFEYQ